MSGIFIVVNSVVGTEVESAIKEMVTLSQHLQIPVHYVHNEILIMVYPWDTAEAVIGGFRRAVEHDSKLAVAPLALSYNSTHE